MDTTELGTNRTGIDTAKARAAEMLTANEEFSADAAADSRPIGLLRQLYAQEADPMGSLPLPATLKGTMKVAADALVGRQPSRLLDKLGERLAFERTGTRLYEAILCKLKDGEDFPGGPTLDQLQKIVLQEYAHFRLVEKIIRDLGADPTVVTPSANLHATMSQGLLAVTIDPRTTLAQCLEAALIAELADNEGWETLLELLLAAGKNEVTDDVNKAIFDESEHLTLVRTWLANAQDRNPLMIPPDDL